MPININLKNAGRSRSTARDRRHLRIRKRINGTAGRPRLVVTRSSRHMVVQVVDDARGVTLASASTMEGNLRSLKEDKVMKAKRVGELVAERAKKVGVDAVVFDRAGYKYHGRVQAVAEGARESGVSL